MKSIRAGDLLQLFIEDPSPAKACNLIDQIYPCGSVGSSQLSNLWVDIENSLSRILGIAALTDGMNIYKEMQENTENCKK